MGAQGTAIIDFGASMNDVREASVIVTGQAGILVTSLAEACLWPIATADHSEDEHVYEAPSFELVIAPSSIVAGTGFTIKALWRPRIEESSLGPGPRPQGQWTVFWVWN